MNWCKPHWSMLRAAIDARGLTKFVAASGQEAHANLAAELRGEEAPFDPLMGSWMAINGTMLRIPALNGRVLMCPCCILVEDHRPELVEDWINGATDQALEYAVANGLVAKQ